MPMALPGSYDLHLVVLSFVVASVASYVALNLAERVTEARGKGRGFWLGGGAMAMGGGIWSMHFTGMLAFQLPTPVAYDIPLVLLSLLVAAAASGVALFVVSRQALTRRSWLYGGVLMGSGVGAMHYTGMAAMRMHAHTSYDPLVFAVSTAVAIAVSLVALWLAFHLRAASPHRVQWRRIGSAVVMGVAIGGMHYTGMAAASFTRAATVPGAASPAISASSLGDGAIALITLLVLGLALGASMLDRRFTAQTRALEVSRRQLVAVVQSANDAIISIDGDGAIIFWNKGAQAIFGYSEEEALGQQMTLVIPERYHEPHQQGVQRMAATGEARVIGHPMELHGLRQDGSEFPLELSLATWATAEGTFYSGIVRDITQRKLGEERLALQYAATAVLAESATLSDGIPHLLHTICERLDWDVGLFWSVDPAGAVLRCQHTWQRPDAGFTQSVALSQQMTLAPGASLPGHVWVSGEPIVLENVSEMAPDPSLHRLESARAEGVRGGFCFPILVGGAVHSVMEFYSRAAWRPNTEMEQAISAIGAQIGQFIERVRAQEALRHQALHDALTGLPNRTLLQDRLDHALQTAQREQGVLSLLLMDLNRFKEINDTLGHQHGDLLLQQVGSRVRDALRASDTVARLGGDEFAVLLPGADAAGAVRVAQAVLAALAAPFDVKGQDLGVGASIGIALFPAHGADVQTLLRQADVAMYVAKRAGSGYAVYDTKHDGHSPARLTLESALRHAIAHGELILHYQPKAEVATGRVHRVEALVRWSHPEQGIIPPDQFIPLAEQTGLIAPLTRWVLDTALRQCRAWQGRGLHVGVAVNLSMRTLHDADLPETVACLLQRYAIAPGLLTLEVTESALMVDPTQAQSVLERLAQLGVKLSIDDFGTGYSSLGYLKQLPVHEIKIDKSFVIGMSANDKDTAIVRSVSDLSHNLGLAVVAEGVEDRATWDLLAALGCDMAQGYYLSRPLPAADLERWLDGSSRSVA